MNAYHEGNIRLVRNSDAYWKVTFDIPPLNIFGPANLPQLEDIVRLLESDDRVKVVVFDSAVDGFFITHYDLLAKPEESAKIPLGRTGLQALPDMLARLRRAPVVSIPPYADVLPVLAANLLSHATCDSPSVTRRFSLNGRLGRGWCQAEDRWRDCRD